MKKPEIFTITILETTDEVLEGMIVGNTCRLTIHNRVGDTDRWTDLSVTLTAEHLRFLSTIPSSYLTPKDQA